MIGAIDVIQTAFRLVPAQSPVIDRRAIVGDARNAAQSGVHPRRSLAEPAGGGVLEHGRVHFGLRPVEIDIPPGDQSADHRGARTVHIGQQAVDIGVLDPAQVQHAGAR
jgi:hypothetical protein